MTMRFQDRITTSGRFIVALDYLSPLQHFKGSLYVVGSQKGFNPVHLAGLIDRRFKTLLENGFITTTRENEKCRVFIVLDDGGAYMLVHKVTGQTYGSIYDCVRNDELIDAVMNHDMLMSEGTFCSTTSEKILWEL